MARESINMEMVKYMKEIMSMTKERDGASINHIPMVLYTRENGPTINSMVLDVIFPITKARQNWVNGIKIC